MKYLWLAFVSLLASYSVAQSQFVYTNNNVITGTANSPNSVSAFLIAADGSLTQTSGSPFNTGGKGGGNNIDPEEIAIASRRNASFLYAANNGSGTISAFAINPSTGHLAHVPGSPFLADGSPGGDYSLAVSPDDKFLFATEDTATVIHIYLIGLHGVLTEVPGSPFPTGANSQGLKVTANGKFLIVGEGSIDAVGVYSISSTGILAAVPGSPFAASATPYDVDANCASDLVFVADSGSAALIDAYSMASTGALTPVTGEPFSNGTTSTNGGLALSPNNQFLFVTDTFSQDISSFSVAPDGALAQIPGSPFATANWTGGTSVTADGKFLYTAFFTTEQVDGRQIGANGTLAAVPGTPFSNEQSQLGVPTVITFPRPVCPVK
jgi:6-phosphogluconolactonase (cycloisomerase 2 family)